MLAVRRDIFKTAIRRSNSSELPQSTPKTVLESILSSIKKLHTPPSRARLLQTPLAEANSRRGYFPAKFPLAKINFTASDI